jgi:hypothetical protein
MASGREDLTVVSRVNTAIARDSVGREHGDLELLTAHRLHGIAPDLADDHRCFALLLERDGLAPPFRPPLVAEGFERDDLAARRSGGVRWRGSRPRPRVDPKNVKTPVPTKAHGETGGVRR